MARRLICVAVSLAVCAAAAGPASATFPGWNGNIAYLWIGESAYRAGPTETSIRTVDPHTMAVRVLRDCQIQITDYGAPYSECGVMPPSWAPDGSELAFPIERTTPMPSGQPLRVDRALATLASHSGSYEEHPTAHRYSGVSWSPAGDQLLLGRELRETGPAGPGLFLASLDGTELRQIGPDLAYSADWSSRGSIAFSRHREPSCLPMCEDIYVMRPGGTPRRLTYRGGTTPSWSPRGTKLVFARVSGGELNLFVVRRNGRALRQLTRRGGYSPAWSPDGKWIAFIRNGDLLVIRPNGRHRRRLVDSELLPNLFEGPQVQALDWQALPRR
jgi:Tol biopolymer transport system component